MPALRIPLLSSGPAGAQAGHPPLVEVLAKRYSKHLQRMIEPMTEVAITVGASQALYMTLQALVDPGDEVRRARAPRR